MSDFAWWKENRAAIVAHSYGDLAVFPNENGDITLKQQDDMMDDDPMVVVPIDSAEHVAAAILEAAKIGRGFVADIKAEPAAAEPERQPRLALVAPFKPRAAGDGA